MAMRPLHGNAARHSPVFTETGSPVPSQESRFYIPPPIIRYNL